MTDYDDLHDHDLDRLMADDGPDLEPGICPACNGSGEGMHDGTRCVTCKGAGLIESRGYIQGWLSGAEISDKSAQRIFGAADKILKAGQ